MSQKICVFLLSIVFSVGLNISPAAACETCTLPQLGKDHGISAISEDKKWFFHYLFEVQNWHEKEAGEAHELHHDGHHFHDKTKEYIQHFKLGRHFLDHQWTLMVDAPYVVRQSIGIHHDVMGEKLESKGLGDVHILGMYTIQKSDSQELRLAGGVKLPTGDTDERNSAGDLFEIEMQPGTGSDDYIIGGIYQRDSGKIHCTGNAFYVFKTEGDRNYEFGNLFVTSLLVEFLIPIDETKTLSLGLDTTLQYEDQHKDAGVTIEDSGGTTLLIGPSVRLGFGDNVSLSASLQLPAYQDLGGVHQELDYTWTAGGTFFW